MQESVIKVGDGRGFIIDAKKRLVITAAHCLPHLPPCHGFSYTHERTYANLLRPLNDSRPEVWAECLFVDPVADIAVLGSPDNQALYDEALAYEELTENRHAFQIGEATAEAWLLTMDGRWVRCSVSGARALWIENAAEGIKGGMSGSPILNQNREAVGVVCLSSGDVGDHAPTQGGPNPRLTLSLPGWLLRDLI